MRKPKPSPYKKHAKSAKGEASMAKPHKKNKKFIKPKRKAKANQVEEEPPPSSNDEPNEEPSSADDDGEVNEALAVSFGEIEC